MEADFAAIQATAAPKKASSSTSAQATKAAAVAKQVQLWEKALGVRITLQRSLVAADRLPRGPAHTAALDTADGVADKVATAKSAAAAVLGECMDTMHELLTRIAESADTPAASGAGEQVAALGGTANACEGAWPLIEKLENRFAPFRNEEIDRWHRRTLLASGQVAMRGGGGLQALNQPLSYQVADVLRNPERALSRTRRRRQQHDRVLCEPATTAAAPADVAGPPETPGDATEAAGGAAGGAELDVESYDDSAFYQLLLNEFLEAAETDGRVSGVAQVRACLPVCRPCSSSVVYAADGVVCEPLVHKQNHLVPLCNRITRMVCC